MTPPINVPGDRRGKGIRLRHNYISKYAPLKIVFAVATIFYSGQNRCRNHSLKVLGSNYASFSVAL